MAVLAATGLPANSNPAHSACYERPTLVKLLQNRFKETLRTIGLASNGTVIEVFTNDSRSTWTITITTPTGVSCILGSGENWERVTPIVGEGV